MLVALGGGVVGDMTGFAAATLLRGIDFVQIPTTLLAQVDSSVGGKTGDQHQMPARTCSAPFTSRVWFSPIPAACRPCRAAKLLAGYAEIVKYGLIRDAEFFEWCERQGNALCELEPEPVRQAVMTSCRMKAAIVAVDEREEGDRALLNFGHTFGHALETETGFSSRLLHGEAVALGMVLAFDFAARLGLVPGRRVSAFVTISRRLGCRRGSPMSGSPASRRSVCLRIWARTKRCATAGSL